MMKLEIYEQSKILKLLDDIIELTINDESLTVIEVDR